MWMAGIIFKVLFPHFTCTHFGIPFALCILEHSGSYAMWWVLAEVADTKGDTQKL